MFCNEHGTVDYCPACELENQPPFEGKVKKWLADQGLVAVPIELTPYQRVIYEKYKSSHYPEMNEHYRADHYWKDMIKTAEEESK